MQVARRKGTDGKLLSMGYGFVETDSVAVAQAVVKQLQVSEVCIEWDNTACTLSTTCHANSSQALQGAALGYSQHEGAWTIRKLDSGWDCRNL